MAMKRDGFSIVGIVIVVATILTACGTPSARPEHWSYAGDRGPDRWSTLTPVYAACGNGQQQSPINIAAERAGASTFRTEYGTTSLAMLHHEHVQEIINNGHTIQVNCDAGSRIVLNGNTYELKQLHFHTPSEHQVGGVSAPMEMHLVHQSASGSLAVVGVLFAVDENAATIFDTLMMHLPDKPGDRVTEPDFVLDLARVLPSTAEAFHYQGSLTTPPCYEGVEWLVFVQPKRVKQVVIDAVHSRIGTNNRPIQALNGRVPTKDITR
jgi:carbonic anhydrase